MSALHDAEEADQEAAERLRLAEWAADHQDPLTAALQRAEHAEAQIEAMRAGLPMSDHIQAAAQMIDDHIGAPANGGTASGAWVKCACGRTVDGVSRDHATGKHRVHVAQELAAAGQLVTDEHDAEVAEAAKAETLAGMTWEHTTRARPVRVPCDCNNPTHAVFLAGDDSPPTHASLELQTMRRLVGPWEPTP